MTDQTLAQLVDAQTSASYKPSDVYSTIIVAYTLCSSEVGENISSSGTIGTIDFTVSENNQAVAISMLASAILNEGRRHIRSRTENIIVRTADKLFTDEMKNMLLVGDQQNEDNIEFYNENPTGHYVV